MDGSTSSIPTTNTVAWTSDDHPTGDHQHRGCRRLRVADHQRRRRSDQAQRRHRAAGRRRNPRERRGGDGRRRRRSGLGEQPSRRHRHPNRHLHQCEDHVRDRPCTVRRHRRHGDQLWVSLWPRLQPTNCAPPGSPPPRESRTSRCPATTEGSAEPAMITSLIGQQLEYATEAKLYNYPDRSGAAGATVVPEVAAAMPAVSADGRTVTIRVRSGYRFSPGPLGGGHARHSRDVPLHDRTQPSPVRGTRRERLPPATATRRRPRLRQPEERRRLAGVSASGDTLTLHLTRPVPDLPQILASPIFSAVPEGTPLAFDLLPLQPVRRPLLPHPTDSLRSSRS